MIRRARPGYQSRPSKFLPGMKGLVIQKKRTLHEKGRSLVFSSLLTSLQRSPLHALVLASTVEVIPSLCKFGNFVFHAVEASAHRVFQMKFPI
jgi:hypothetical protein